MEKAYMIRNDGKLIPCVQHYYGNIDEVTETLYAGEWLYKNTQKSFVKDTFLDLVVLYGVLIEGVKNKDSFIEDLKRVIDTYPYKYLSKEFVDDHSAALLSRFDNVYENGGKSDLKGAMKEIISDLNQEFLRARYGGLYNTNSSSREMVFRISSNNFNWYNIIWEFVYNNKNQIDAVTIVRDEESTGVPNYFYKNRDGDEYNQMPTDDFLTEKGNPVVESEDVIKLALRNGIFGKELYSVIPMNRERITYRLKCLFEQENRERLLY